MYILNTYTILTILYISVKIVPLILGAIPSSLYKSCRGTSLKEIEWILEDIRIECYILAMRLGNCWNVSCI